jgi:hypothetical protein
VVGVLLKVLQRLEKRTEGLPMPPLPPEPGAEFWSEVVIRASCQAVWDLLEAPTAPTDATDPNVKVVSFAGPPPADGGPRNFTFRTTDRGQLGVVTTTVVSEASPHESVRRLTDPARDVVEVLERHTLTKVPEGCRYRVAIEWRAPRHPVRLSQNYVSTVKESLAEFTAKIRFLTES